MVGMETVYCSEILVWFAWRQYYCGENTLVVGMEDSYTVVRYSCGWHGDSILW